MARRTALLGRALREEAWSQNLTAEKCEAVGVFYVSKEDLTELSQLLIRRR